MLEGRKPRKQTKIKTKEKGFCSPSRAVPADVPSVCAMCPEQGGSCPALHRAPALGRLQNQGSVGS